MSSAKNTVALLEISGSQCPLPTFSPRLGLSVILLSMIFKSSPLFRHIRFSSLTQPRASPSPRMHPAEPGCAHHSSAGDQGDREGLSFSILVDEHQAEGHWPGACGGPIQVFLQAHHLEGQEDMCPTRASHISAGRVGRGCPCDGIHADTESTWTWSTLGPPGHQTLERQAMWVTVLGQDAWAVLYCRPQEQLHCSDRFL